MAIVKRGENTYLIRVHLGLHPITKKKVQLNETFHGAYEDALKQEQLLKQKAAKDEIPKASKERLNALIDLYLENTCHFRDETTQHLIISSFDRYVRPYLGNHKVEKIKRFDIQQFLNFLLDPQKVSETSGSSGPIRNGLGLGAYTVRKVRDCLNAMFNFAHDMELISSNPVRRTRIPPLPQSSINPLTFEEAWAFTSVRERYWYGNAFVFNLHTGLRPQELMALIEDDIDFEAGTLRVERACKWLDTRPLKVGRTKTRSSERIIQLDADHLEFLRLHLGKLKQHTEEQIKKGHWKGEPKIEDWLREYRPKQGHLYKKTNLIFPSMAGNIPNIIPPRRCFKAMLKRAGLTGERLKVRWYDLRHTHATLLLNLGVPDHEVAARLGHSVDMLNKTYAHVLPDRQRVASSFFVSLLPLYTSGILDKNETHRHFNQVLERVNSNLESNLLSLIGIRK